MIWRLVLETNVPLKELETWWSIDDVVRANAFLDVKAEINDVASDTHRKELEDLRRKGRR